MDTSLTSSPKQRSPTRRSPPTPSSPHKYKHYYMALDIEMGGPIMTVHPLVAIGWAICDQHGTVVEKRRFPVPFSICDFDENCLRGFWQNEKDHPGISQLLHTFHEEGQQFTSVGDAIRVFVKAFDDVTQKYRNLTLVSDFPEFDIGILNYYVGKYARRRLLNYYGKHDTRPCASRSIGTFYHSQSGVKNRYKTSPCRDEATRRLKQLSRKSYTHTSTPDLNTRYDHCPENDAEDMVVRYVHALQLFYNQHGSGDDHNHQQNDRVGKNEALDAVANDDEQLLRNICK